MCAVDELVGGHDVPDTAFLHSGFEGGQVDFVEGALADGFVDTVALELLIISGEVFEAGDDAFALDAVDVGDAELAGEIGVFAVAFEVASPERLAVDVDGGAEDHVAAEGFGLLGDGLAFLLDQRSVPRGGHADAGGEGGGFDAHGRVGGRGDGGAAEPGADAHGAVCHFDGGDAEAQDGGGFHPAGAGEHGDFFVEGHAGEQV